MKLLDLMMKNGVKICNFNNNFIFIELLYINLYNNLYFTLLKIFFALKIVFLKTKKTFFAH